VGREIFDPFVQRYIAGHKFQSLTTEDFVAYLKLELPAAASAVDLDEWIYKPGLPADYPVFTSTLYEDLKARTAAYEQGGVLPRRDEVQDWHYLQRRLFLRMLPPKIPAEHCRQLEANFNFKPGDNIRLLFEFYRICVRSGYREVLPGIERYVERVGRHAFLAPLIQSMAETPWSKDLARPVFERVRRLHHPITVANVESVPAKRVSDKARRCDAVSLRLIGPARISGLVKLVPRATSTAAVQLRAGDPAGSVHHLRLEAGG
jgi:hypothetical protein